MAFSLGKTGRKPILVFTSKRVPIRCFLGGRTTSPVISFDSKLRSPGPTWLRRLSTIAPTEDKKRVVIIGTGWAGTRMARNLSCELFDINVVSPRNHFVFTPLLPQTTTGTLEFRAVCEPIFNAQPALSRSLNAYVPGSIYEVDPVKKEVKCVAMNASKGESTVQYFSVPYDFLILAHGAEPLTFGVPGVEEHAHFLREVPDARAIRRAIVRNMGLAGVPGLSEAELRRLLHVVVVGGGPTGVEFAGDLCDFIHADLERIRPHLRKFVKVTMIEAVEILGTFDQNLRTYATRTLQQQGVEIKKAAVKEVRENDVLLGTGEVLPYGVMVWSTGVGPSRLTKQLPFDKSSENRIAVNEHLHVLLKEKPVEGVYAIGDCSGYHPKIGKKSLPCLAAVAERQAKYLAGMLNKLERERTEETAYPIFKYNFVGSMATLGSHKALVDLPSNWDITGFRAWLTWRMVYLSLLGSWRSRLYVLAQWTASSFFGRDVTYIADGDEVAKGRQIFRKVLDEHKPKEPMTKP